MATTSVFHFFHFLLLFCLLTSLSFFGGCSSSFSSQSLHQNLSIRPMNVADTFYPARSPEAKEMIHHFLNQATLTDYNAYWGSYAFVVPHAAWKYAGTTMAYAWKVLDHFMDFMPRNLTFVILAPSHYVAFSGVSLASADAYQTPFGLLPIVHQDSFLGALHNASLLNHLFQAHEREHSIEVQLPWLDFLCKKHNKQCSILPLLIGSKTSYDDLLTLGNLIVRVYGERLGNDVFLVVSTDFTHYGKAYGYVPFTDSSPEDLLEKLFVLNKQAYDIFSTNSPPAFAQYEQKTKNTICGRDPLLILLAVTRQMSGEWMLLQNSSSYAITKTPDQIVWYASFAVRGKKQGITKPQEKLLLRLAKKSIQQAFDQTFNEIQLPYVFFQKQACFVTLEKQGQLRGCIGTLKAKEQLWQCIIKNAKNAAFHDPRFQPLQEQELPALSIEISLLTQPQPLSYTTREELLAALNHSVGVVLQYGWKQATFLPQVWEQLPEKGAFLSALCKKANAPKDCWKYHPDIWLYHDIIIRENPYREEIVQS